MSGTAVAGGGPGSGGPAVRAGRTGRAGRATDAGRWAGAGSLLRVELRADRVRLLIWLVAVTGAVYASADSEATLFATEQARAARAELMRSPAATALAGPGYGLDDYTIGAMVANELGAWVALAFAFMSVFIAVRHLRGAEEDGLLELVRAAPVGRWAAVPAAMGVVLVADLLVGVGLVLALVGAGLPVGGAVAFAAGAAGVGLVFGAVGAVTSQLAARARTASVLGVAAIGVGFLLRAVGDVRAPHSGSAFSWASPFGWSQATRAWVELRWWPLSLLPAAALLLTVVAGVLAARRDVGAALLPDRSGRAGASGRLRGIVTVTVRRQAGVLAAWTVGSMALCGLVGVLARQVLDFIEQEPSLAQILGGGSGGSGTAATDPVFARYLVLAACLAGAAGVSGVMAVHTDEGVGRAGQVLAAPVGRVHWLIGQAVVPLVGAMVVLAAGGLTMGLTAAWTLDDPGLVGKLTSAGLVHLPAVWCLTALTVLLVGAWPRLTVLAWIYLGYAVFTGMLGEMLPAHSDAVSVLHLTPALPGAAMDWTPVLAMTAVAAMLIAGGAAGVRRRDLLA